MRKARYYPLAQCALMESVKMMSLRKDVVRNSDEHSLNVDRNGVPGDGKEVGLQPVDVVSWLISHNHALPMIPKIQTFLNP